jgi:hypothetical protein
MSRYVTDNKLVLSYLSLRLLSQYSVLLRLIYTAFWWTIYSRRLEKRTKNSFNFRVDDVYLQMPVYKI